jgi:hypothetical protein
MVLLTAAEEKIAKLEGRLAEFTQAGLAFCHRVFTFKLTKTTQRSRGSK